MSNLRIIMLLTLLSLLGGSMAADDTFNPNNPPEPNDNYYKYNLKVNAIPADKVSASGTGRYIAGERVTVGSSASEANWYFVKWLKNGVDDNSHKTASFSYITEAEDVTFTAVYEYREPTEPDVEPFDPANPAEPETIERPITPPETTKYVLNLVNVPREAASFNTNSGNKYAEGTRIFLKANGSQYFEFNGWYDQNGTKLSDLVSFNFTMPAEETTLTARWTYNPFSPDDPFSDSNQSDIDNTIHGDVNSDGDLSVTDVMLVIQYVLEMQPENFDSTAADMDKNGSVSVTDAMLMVQEILK